MKHTESSFLKTYVMFAHVFLVLLSVFAVAANAWSVSDLFPRATGLQDAPPDAATAATSCTTAGSCLQGGKCKTAPTGFYSPAGVSKCLKCAAGSGGMPSTTSCPCTVSHSPVVMKEVSS